MSHLSHSPEKSPKKPESPRIQKKKSPTHLLPTAHAQAVEVHRAALALARENLGRQVGHGTAEGPGFLGGFLADVWDISRDFSVFLEVEVTVEGFLAF